MEIPTDLRVKDSPEYLGPPEARKRVPVVPEDLRGVNDPEYQGPPAYEAALTRIHNRAFSVASMAEDPRQELAKIAAATMLSDRMGYTPQFAFEHFDTLIEDWLGSKELPLSAFQSMKRSWDTGMLNMELGYAGNDLWEAVLAGQDPTAILERVAELESQLPPVDEMRRNLPMRVIKMTLETLPAMMEPMMGGAAVGALSTMALVGMGIVTGGIAPAITLGSLLTATTLMGTSAKSMQIMRGHQMLNLFRATDDKGNRVDPRYALAASGVYGFLGALVETAQFEHLLPGGQKALGAITGKAMKRIFGSNALSGVVAQNFMRYGSTAISEGIEETIQQAIEILTEEMALEAANREGAEFDKETFKGALKRMGDDFVAGFAVSSLLALPGSTINLLGDLGQGTAQMRAEQARERAKKPTEEYVQRVRESITGTPDQILQGLEAERAKVLENFRKDPVKHAHEMIGIETEIAEAQKAIRPEAVTERPAYEMTRAEFEAAEGRVEAESGQTQGRVEFDEGSLRRRISEAFPQYTPQEVDVAAMLWDVRAEKLGMPTEQWVRTYVAPEIFGDPATLPADKRGGVQFLEDGKALIYASQSADFSTWVHETAHIFRKQLTPDEMSLAAKAFGVEDGQWIRTVETLEDGRYRVDSRYFKSQENARAYAARYEERFARGFEDYLRTGKAPTPQLQGIFSQMAEWLRRVYGALRGEISPEIQKVYEALLTTDQMAPGMELSAATLYQPMLATDSFRRWFGDSRVVDESGTPTVVYHGTDQAFTQFDLQADRTSFGFYGEGFYFTPDSELASGYVTGWGDRPVGANVKPVFLSLQNPFEMPTAVFSGDGMVFEPGLSPELQQAIRNTHRGLEGEAALQAARDLTTQLKREGYDGVIKRLPDGTIHEIVAFAPEQIKSVYNQGGWDPSNPDMLYQSGLTTPAELKRYTDLGIPTLEAAKIIVNKTPIQDILFQRKRQEWTVDYNDLEFSSVNNRLSKEVEVMEHILGPLEGTIEVALKRDEKGQVLYGKSMEPRKLFEAIYDNLDTFRTLLDTSKSVDQLITEMGIPKERQQAFKTEVDNLRNGPLVFDVDALEVAAKGNPFLADNGKAGKSVDFLLSTCDPTEPCKVCYASKAMIRMSAVRKALRNTVWVLVDPVAFGERVAAEVKRVPKAQVPFLRLLGSGDLTTTEQITAFNTIAKNLDRPIQIFSRHHDMLAQLQGTAEAPFIKMGSIDRQLFTHYGADFLAKNLEERGIINAFLFEDPQDLPHLQALYDRHAVGLVLAADHDLHNALPREIQMSSCPCDAGARTYVASCRMCALNQAGCFMSAVDKGIDRDGKIWRLDDPKAPDSVVPMLNFGQESPQMWAEVAKSVLQKSVELVQLYRRQLVAGERDSVPLKDLRYPESVDRVTTVEAVDAYLDMLRGEIAKIKEGTFSLPSSELQPGIRMEGWVRQTEPDGTLPVQELLFQEGDEHRNMVRQAVAEGRYVPDRVLAEYAQDAWAQEEIRARRELHEEARVADSPEVFADQEVELGDASREYYEALWNEWHNRPLDPAAQTEAFLASLDKAALANGLMDMATDPNVVLESLPQVMREAAEAIARGDQVTDTQFNQVLDQIKSDPMRYREALIAAAADEGAIRVELENEANLARRVKEALEHDKKVYPEISDKMQTLGQYETEIRSLQGKLNYAWRTFADAIDSGNEDAMIRLAEIREELQKRKRGRQYLAKLVREVQRRPAATLTYARAREILDIQEGLDFKGTAKVREARQQLREYVAAHPNEILPESTVREAQRRHVKELQVGEIETLAQKVRQLREVGRMERLVEMVQEKAIIEGARSAIKTQLSGGEPKRPAGIGSLETSRERRQTLGRGIQAETLRMNRLAQVLDGDQKGVAYQWLWDEVNLATDAELRGIDVRVEAGQQKMRELGIRTRDLARTITVGDFTYTVDEVISMWLAMQNEDSAMALMFGNGLDKPTIDAFIKELTPAQVDWAKWMMHQDFGEVNFDRAQEVLIKEKNRAARKVTNYFPMLRQDINYETLNQAVAEEILARTAFRPSYPRKGFMIERQKIRPEYQSPIRLGATAIWMEQVAKQEKYIASAITVQRLHKIFGDSQVREAITQNFGNSFNKVVEKYINDFANPNIYKTFDAASNVSRKLRTNFATAVLAGNALTILKQLPSVAFYLSEAGPSHLLGAAGQFATGMRRVIDFVNERDPQMKHRSYDRFQQELRLAAAGGYERMVQGIGRVGMAGIMAMDRAATTIGWKAVYDKNIREGKSEAQAVKAAQEATLRTQSAARAKDLANLYRSSEGLNWFLMFTNQLNQIWNIVSYDIPNQLRHKAMIPAMMDATAVVLSAIAIGMITLKRPPDSAEEAAQQMVGELLSAIPVVGGSIKSGLDGWFGTGVDPVPVASQLGRTARVLMDSEKELEQKAEALWRVVPDAMMILGLPATAYRRVRETIETGDPWELIGGPPKER